MVPSAYTESQLAAYVVSFMGETGAALGWEGGAELDEVVNDTLILYGVSDIADATDIAKLRTLAKVSAWRNAIPSLAARYTFTTDQQSFQRSDQFKAAMTALKRAEDEASAAGYNLSPDPTPPNITIQPVRYIHDPYDEQIPVEDRVLP